MSAQVSRSRTLVVGAAGRLGRVVCKELEAAGHIVVPAARLEVDVTDAAAVDRLILATAPSVIVNCTAYNAVDGAESEQATAYAVNGRGAGLLAAAAERVGASFVHFSTDFVFDGTSRTPYTEEDEVNPLSVYGSSKLEGELEVRARCSRHFILRVASLFGGDGVRGHRATIDHIADSLLEGRPVRALVDRTVSPSFVPHIAHATKELIDRSAPAGTYHCVATGVTTWFEMAQYIAQLLGVSGTIEPVHTNELTMKAPRPQFCGLSNQKIRALGIEMPDWKFAVAQHLQQKMQTTAIAGSR